MTDPPDAPLLDEDAYQALVEAASFARLYENGQRQLFTRALSHEVAGHLREHATPRAQLMSDLDALRRHGPSTLAIWFEVAVGLAPKGPARAQLERFAADLGLDIDPGRPGLDRRAILRAAAAVFGGGLVGGSVAWVHEALGDPRRALPERLERIFPLREAALVPGNANLDSLRQMHPDINDALGAMFELFRGPADVSMTVQNTLPVRPDGDLVLVGGPVSSLSSRAWRGFAAVGPDGAFVQVKAPAQRLRWEFCYHGIDWHGPAPRRYLSSQEKDSRPKWIIDREGGGPVPYARDTESGFLDEDLLLVTVIRNPFAGPETSKPTWLVDVADLFGQGDKAFGSIMADPHHVAALHRQVEAHGCRAFQALYRVPIDHDHDWRRTVLRPLEQVTLVGVHPIG